MQNERRGGVHFRFNSKLRVTGLLTSLGTHQGPCCGHYTMCYLDCEPCFRVRYLASLLLKRPAAVLFPCSYPISGQACTELKVL